MDIKLTIANIAVLEALAVALINLGVPLIAASLYPFVITTFLAGLALVGIGVLLFCLSIFLTTTFIASVLTHAP